MHSTYMGTLRAAQRVGSDGQEWKSEGDDGRQIISVKMRPAPPRTSSMNRMSVSTKECKARKDGRKRKSMRRSHMEGSEKGRRAMRRYEVCIANIWIESERAVWITALCSPSV